MEFFLTPATIKTGMLKLEKKFFEAFISGTIHTMKVQCNIEISATKPFLKGTHPQQDIALTAVVAIISSQFIGSIQLSFSEPVFLALMNSMLGETFPEITAELTSGASEILNIIYGTAKTVLNKSGYDIKTAIPTVIWGHALKSTALTTSPTLVLPFSTQHGNFYLEITEQEKWNDGTPATKA